MVSNENRLLCRTNVTLTDPELSNLVDMWNSRACRAVNRSEVKTRTIDYVYVQFYCKLWLTLEQFA